MKFEQGRMNINLNGALPKGPKHIMRAAKDPVCIPTEPVIVQLAERCLCKLGLGVNCYTLTNMYGVTEDVPYGASVAEWTMIAEDLLEQAINEDNTP